MLCKVKYIVGTILLTFIIGSNCIKRCPNTPKISNLSVTIELFSHDPWYLTARTEIDEPFFSIFKFALNPCHRFILKTRPCDSERIRVDCSCLWRLDYQDYNNIFLIQIYENIFGINSGNELFCLQYRYREEKLETFTIVGTDYKNYLILYSCQGGLEVVYILETKKPKYLTSKRNESSENIYSYRIQNEEVYPKFKELEQFKNFTFKSNQLISKSQCKVMCTNLFNANYQYFSQYGCGKYSPKFHNSFKSKYSADNQIMSWLMKVLLLIAIIIVPMLLICSDYITKFFI